MKYLTGQDEGMGSGKRFLLAASLWAVAVVSAAAPRQLLTQTFENLDSTDAMPVLEPVGAVAPLPPAAAEPSAAPLAEYRPLESAAIVAALNKRAVPLDARGLQWSINGARPTLEYRLAPNQVLRLRGVRNGASLTVLWEF